MAWYSATNASADVAAASVGIADSVNHFMPGAGDRLRRRVRMGDAPQNIVPALGELMAEDLVEWPAGAWLVIDDYHLLMPSKAAEEFVDWLLALTPIRLLVTTRQRPTWATTRRAVTGDTLELTQHQLAMTHDEARAMLSQRPTASVRKLIAKAEGWPALVGLSSALDAASLSESALRTTVFRYLAEEVFQTEPPAIQRLLTVASLPPSFGLEFLREVAEVANPQEALDHLFNRGLIQTVEDRYCLHPLLREFLSSRLRGSSTHAELRRMSDKTVDHARADGFHADAFDIALQHRRQDLAIEIATEAAPSLLMAGKLETLSSWFRALARVDGWPPSLALAQADVLTRRGDLLGAIAASEALGSKLQRRSTYATRAWCMASRAHHLNSDPERALETSARACADACTPEDEHEATWRALCAAKDLALPDHEQYLRAFERAAGPSLDAQVRVACGRISLASREGRLVGLWRTLRPILDKLDEVSDPMISLGSLVAYVDLATLRADYRGALHLSVRGLEIARLNRIELAVGAFLAGKAQALTGLRRTGRARVALNELGSFSAAKGDAYTELSFRSAELRLKILEGSLGVQPVRAEDLDLVPKLRVYLAAHLGITALMCAGAGSSSEALTRSEQATVIASTGETRAYAELTRLILAIREQPDSADVLDQGIQLIEQYRDNELLDPLVLAYRAYPPMLELFGQHGSAAPILADLLVASNDTSLAEAAGISLASARGAVNLLTPREIEVMGLILRGLTNAAIADELVISRSTAKVHVRNIMKKYGVRTRVELVLLLAEGH